MNKFLSAFAAAGICTFLASGAHATVAPAHTDCACDGSALSGAFAVSIWSADTPDANYSSANQQALPTNPIITSNNLVSTGVYTGNLNFDYDPRQAPATIAGFLATGTGTYSGSGNTSVALSSGSYAHATIIEFSFTISKALTGIAISHDDGVSLYAANNPTNDLLASSAANPTTETDATLATLGAGTYNLWYAEVNGVPAVLCFDPDNGGTTTLPPTSTPEPASIVLLAVGLATVGFVRRRAA